MFICPCGCFCLSVFPLSQCVCLSISLSAQRADFGQTELAQTKFPLQIDIYCYRRSRLHINTYAFAFVVVVVVCSLNACLQVDDFDLVVFWSSWSTPALWVDVDRWRAFSPLSDTNLRLTLRSLIIDFGDSPTYLWQSTEAWTWWVWRMRVRSSPCIMYVGMDICVAHFLCYSTGT